MIGLVVVSGVTVNREGKLMIPSQKLTLSEQLCKAATTPKGKKCFACQVCSKFFFRKDKINYHIYTEHHDQFVKFGKDNLPQILTKKEEQKAATSIKLLDTAPAATKPIKDKSPTKNPKKGDYF